MKIRIRQGGVEVVLLIAEGTYAERPDARPLDQLAAQTSTLTPVAALGEPVLERGQSLAAGKEPID